MAPVQRVLNRREAGSAAQIQAAIDAMALSGGCLRLPAMDLTLDRSLILRSGVELAGAGADTVLRKAPAREYPLTGYHNYGMCDVPVQTSAGLAPGMTVSVHDDRTHGGFYETFAVVTWVDGGWIGLDHGIEADYRGDACPCLTTAFPLIYGHHIRHAAVRDMRLEGNRAADAVSMGGCRGGAVYFANSRGLEVSGVVERDYHGEGLSFQMCRDVRILSCRFDDNTGNGLHPGAGSTNALFADCAGSGNQRSGFFFCVRANRITVRDGAFRGNATGVSIGTRDCHNLVEGCSLTGNAGPGLLVRPGEPPVEVHSCIVRACRLTGNACQSGAGQVDIPAYAHDLVLERNAIEAAPDRVGVAVAAGAEAVYLDANTWEGRPATVSAAPAALTHSRPVFECGYGDWPPSRFRHLDTA